MMRSVVPIKEFAVGIYDGPHATPKPSDEGPIFLGIKNVTEDGRLDFSELRHVSEAEFPKWIRRIKPQRDDIVFSYEATLHRYARIPDGFEGCLGRRMALLRPDQDKVDPRFLHYYFLSPAWRAKMDAIKVTGATVDRIPLTIFPDTEVSLPGLENQFRIADVLSAYDDLIENNWRRIALLEEAARLLYREWFVHFRFPGHEHVKITDGLPVGWEQRVLGDVVEVVRDTVKPSDFEDDDIHIGLEHIPRRSFTLADWELAEDLASSKTRFEEGDILFCKIRPYFHKVGFTLRAGVASSDAMAWRVKDAEDWPLAVCATSSDHFVAVASKTVREGSKCRGRIGKCFAITRSRSLLRDYWGFSTMQSIRSPLNARLLLSRTERSSRPATSFSPAW